MQETLHLIAVPRPRVVACNPEAVSSERAIRRPRQRRPPLTVALTVACVARAPVGVNVTAIVTLADVSRREQASRPIAEALLLV
jgi:hypothetical protein